MTEKLFRIAHFSDPHIGPLPPVRVRDLMGKRLTGFLNWHQARKGVHDMALLGALVRDIEASAPDLVLVGGDIVNIGLPAEFAAARSFVERIGPPERVLVVPGNHDAYVGASFPAMRRHLGPWMAGDAGVEGRFPYVVRRGRIAVVALNSGAPSFPFYATGRLGRAQIEAAGEQLAGLGRDGAFRVILVHHAPHVGGSRIFRNLTDAPAFEAMLRTAGAELILHGHNHRISVAWRRGAGGRVPIVGVGSASAAGGTLGHRATWHRIDIRAGGTGSRLTIASRTADGGGAFVEKPIPLEN